MEVLDAFGTTYAQTVYAPHAGEAIHRTSKIVTADGTKIVSAQAREITCGCEAAWDLVCVTHAPIGS